MATITLNANYGKGEFKNLGLSFNSAKQNTSNLASSLQKLKNKVISVETVADAVAIGKPASTTVKNAEKREENKKSALSVAYEKLDQLLSDVGSIDDKVAGAITANKKAFYKKYSWLKPECEKGFFEKARDYLWNKVCGIGNAIKNVVIEVGKWLKEHWKLIATALIVIVSIVLICTGVGGIIGAAALGAIIGAAVGGMVGGIIGGIKSIRAGKSFWSGFLKGFEDGAFSGAISGAISGGMGEWLSAGGEVTLSLMQEVLIGGTAEAGSSVLGNLGDKFIKGEKITFGDILWDAVCSFGMGAAFSFVAFYMPKIKISGINQGKGSWLHVWTSQFHRDGTRIHLKTLFKGLAGTFIDEFWNNVFEIPKNYLGN